MLTASYGFSLSYTSDVYTAPMKSSISSLKFQTLNNIGFIPKIKVTNSSIKLQDITSNNLTELLLNHAEADDYEDGDLSAKIKVDDTKIKEAVANKKMGTYDISYTVTDKDGNQASAVASVTLYSDITVHYKDEDGNSIQEDRLLSGNLGENYDIETPDLTYQDKVYSLLSAEPSKLAGLYGEENQPTEITLIYQKTKQTLIGSDFTMYVGDPTPTADDFKSTATNKEGNKVKVSVDLSKADLTKAGDYTVTLTSEVGQVATVKLIVKDKKIPDTRATANGTPTVSSSGSPSRSLPQTGEKVPYLAVFIGIVLVLGVGILFFLKRKKDKDN